MSPRPNFILLVGEDTGCHQGCYGDPVGHTPAIDQLAREGARYEHACSTAPVCAPSRSALMMGKTAFSQGSHHMRSFLHQPPKLFTQALREAGYYVNWTNKTDFNFDPPEDFADDRSEWFDDLAAGNLPGQPWLLYYNFQLTHESSMWPEVWEEKRAGLLSDDELTDPATVPVPAYLPDAPEVRADIARYYDMLRGQDKLVARALAALDQSGQRDNTIVIYMSDHGRGLIREKRFCYEAGVRLPLIVRAPGLLDPGTVSPDLVSWLDIAPTLIDLGGAEPLPNAQGRIFFGPNAQPAPDYIFSGRDRMDNVFDRVRTARSQQYRYIRNDFPDLPYASHLWYMEKQLTSQAARRLYAEGQLEGPAKSFFLNQKPAEELYDVQADPDNVRNLADDPAMADTLRTHREALAAFLERTGDLGEVPERELIDRGLVMDKLAEYYERVEPLPPEQRVGRYETAPVEMPEQ